MSDSLLFLSGQISVLETQLLQPGQLDRMIGSRSPEEAFSVLSELSYAQYFDEELKASSFVSVLSQGLKETKAFLDENLENPSHRMLLWLEYDLNNIKRAAKDRFLFGKETLTEFTEDNGYIDLGNLSLEDLQALIYEEEKPAMLPKEVYQVLVDFAALEDGEIKDLDQNLDEAYLLATHRLSKWAGEGLKHVATQQIDAYNLRSTLRNIATIGSDTSWLTGGTLKAEDFANLENVDAFMNALEKTDLAFLANEVKTTQPLEQQLNQFESSVDHYLSQLMKERSQSSDGLLKVLYYFQKRWMDARMIKVIMFGKFYGLESHIIEEKVKNLLPQ